MMVGVSRLLLLAWFAAAQSLVWTDCAESFLCPDKGDCSDDCGKDGCCPSETSLCAHLEPQSDVERTDVAPSVFVAVAIAVIEPAGAEADATPSLPRPDVPPRLRPRRALRSR